MLRYLAVLLIFPSVGAADWAPRPIMFSFDATFAQCMHPPQSGDLAQSCADQLAAAYVLKRAVANAAHICADTPLPDCAAPLEDEGLPAIAARIAGDIGCQTTDIAMLPTNAPLPDDHCVTIAADIMIDEGVVPVNTDILCGPTNPECDDLARIHVTLWGDAIAHLAGDDPTIADLMDRNRNDCSRLGQQVGHGTDGDALSCLASRSAALWADLQTKD